MRKRGAYAGTLILVAVFALPLPAPNALAHALCFVFGTPPPGSTVEGGLDVDGDCEVTNVTVHGGIHIRPSSALEFDGGTVDGGITSSAGSLFLDSVLFSGRPTGTSSTITGGIRLTLPPVFSIWNAKVDGVLQITDSSAILQRCAPTTLVGM